MYHSLYFTNEDNEDWGGYDPSNPWSKVFNTYGTWGLIANERPVISMPPVKTQFTEQDYVSGSIDNTTTLTKVPTYGDRTGSITFYVTEPGNWPDTLLDLSAFFHGKRLKMWLEDDPEYYYIGRWAVNQWGSSEKFSTIQLDYTLYPFKISKLTTLNDNSDWLWDDFNFDNGALLPGDYTFTFQSNLNWVSIHQWSGLTNYGKINRRLTQGIVAPTITWTALDNNDLDIRFTNKELDINVTTRIAKGSSIRTDILFSNLSRANIIRCDAKGNGTLSFEMRRLVF